MQNKNPLTVWRESQEPKMSQDELAAKLGVTRWMVNRVECWKRRPSLNLAVKIEGVTGLPPSSFATRPATEAAE